MAYVIVAHIVVLLVLAGLLALWIVLAVRRGRAMGLSASLRGREWFVTIFSQGLALIRRCPWILLIPLAVELARTDLHITLWHAHVQRHATAFANQPLFSSRGLSVLLRRWPQTLWQGLLHALEHLDTALSSSALPMAAAILVSGGLFLLFRALASNTTLRDSPGRGSGWRGGVISGLVCLGLGALLAWCCLLLVRGAAPRRTIWIPLSILIVIPCAFVQAGVASVLLVLMDGAAHGQKLSLKDGISGAGTHFRPLIFFMLMTSGVAMLHLMPGYVGSMLRAGGGRVCWWLWILSRSAGKLWLAAVTFAPYIVATRRATLPKALRYCLDLWARHWRNAGVFLGISVLALLFPVILERCASSVFSYASWFRQLIQLLLSLLRTALCVLIACSTMMFVRAISECDARQAEPETGEMR